MKRSDIVSPKGEVSPIEDDHPAVGQPCCVCGKHFIAGDQPSVVIIRNRANVTLDIAHEDCAYTEED